MTHCCKRPILSVHCDEREIRPEESHEILAKSVRLNAHEESKGKTRQDKTSDGRKHLCYKCYFCAQLAFETCDKIYEISWAPCV